MKITFIAGTLGVGGAEKQLYLLSKSLLEKGHHVSICTLTEGEYWEAKLKEIGATVIPCGQSSNKWKRLIQIYKVVREIRPEILYSFHFYASTYAGLVGRLLGITSFGSIRNDGHVEKKSNGIMSYFHYHLPNAVIANSKHGLDNAQKIFLFKKNKTFILPNGIEVEKVDFKPVLFDDSFKLLFVGRLNPVKRPHLFIDVINRLIGYQNQVTGTVLGDGACMDELKHLLKSKELERHVVLKGRVNNVIEYYQTHHVLLSFSKAEGTPNVLLEAMLSGLPVISLSFKGVTDLLGHNSERGKVCLDIDQMIEELIKLSTNGININQLKAAREFVIINYDSNFLSKKFEDIVYQFI